MSDGLRRFIEAQDGVYETALGEITAGRKRSHWMWFIFPQLKSLGLSPTAQYYGIVSLEEAKAYLADSRLGPRLVGITEAAIAAPAASLRDLFGSPDDLKFRSSMTLFEAAGQGPFAQALDVWCGGVRDARTLELLA